MKLAFFYYKEFVTINRQYLILEKYYFFYILSFKEKFVKVNGGLKVKRKNGMRFLAIMMTSFLFAWSANARMTPEGFFGEWRVYTTKEGSGTVCFMVTAPQHTNVEREGNFLSVTHRPNENSYDVLAVMFGVPYHKTSRPTIEIDNHRPLEMKTSDDAAFIKDEKEEKRFIQEMIKGNVARTKGKSKKGTVLRETYSLKGFSKAYELLNEKCRPDAIKKDVVKENMDDKNEDTK